MSPTVVVCNVGRPVSLQTIAVINSARIVLERVRQRAGTASPSTPQQAAAGNSVPNARNLLTVSDILHSIAADYVLNIEVLLKC